MTDEEIETEWQAIIFEVARTLPPDQVMSLSAAVEYPALPENRAQLLNTCHIYPPETITVREAKIMMIEEWRKRRAIVGEVASAFTSPVAPATYEVAWPPRRILRHPEQIRRQPPVRRNAMRRNAPVLRMIGTMLNRDKVVRRKRVIPLRLAQPEITPDMMAHAIRAALRAGWNPGGLSVVVRVLDQLRHHIRYNIPTHFDNATGVEEVVMEAHEDESESKTPATLTWDEDTITQLKAYLREHGGVEIRELLEQETREHRPT